jgi:hypothetical protein
MEAQSTGVCTNTLTLACILSIVKKTKTLINDENLDKHPGKVHTPDHVRDSLRIERKQCHAIH